MPVLVILIIFSLAFYIFYKTKYFRTQLPAEKRWISSKSSIALGSFVGLFGLNQLFLYQTTVTYIIAGLFIILGAINIWGGVKAYKYFLPLAAKEVQECISKNKKERGPLFFALISAILFSADQYADTSSLLFQQDFLH